MTKVLVLGAGGHLRDIHSRRFLEISLCCSARQVSHWRAMERTYLSSSPATARPKRFELLTPRFVVPVRDRRHQHRETRNKIAQKELALLRQRSITMTVIAS